MLYSHKEYKTKIPEHLGHYLKQSMPTGNAQASETVNDKHASILLIWPPHDPRSLITIMLMELALYTQERTKNFLLIEQHYYSSDTCT
jgi:hypothetical protein